MLEYVFFDPRPLDKFLAFLGDKGVVVDTSVRNDAYDTDSLLVWVPEDLDDVLADEIEDRYDELMAWNLELADQMDDGSHAAGVVVNLRDGRSVYAQVDPRLLGKVMEVLTAQEFGAIVDAVVEAVENPDERSICRRAED